jgi:hypothetical protein
MDFYNARRDLIRQRLASLLANGIEAKTASSSA